MKRASYRTVLFDWDGTLADSLAVWSGAYIDSLAAFGVNPTPDAVAALWGHWRNVAWLGIAEEDVETWGRDLFRRVSEGLTTVDVRPGTRELLDDLRGSGAAVGLVTTTGADMVLSALRRL